MNKYNHPILRQLLDEKWNTDDIAIPVTVRQVAPRFVETVQVVGRQTIRRGEGVDYATLADALVIRLKWMLGEEAKKNDFSHVTIFPQSEPYAPDHSWMHSGNIITPNKYIFGRFLGKDNKRLFWGDVFAEARIRVVFDYNPLLL